MKYTPIEPPRRFEVGLTQAMELRDCARIELGAGEQVTFVTPAGGEYDVVRTAWGFYATPSLNHRLPRFGLRGLLVRNRLGHLFVLLVERGHEEDLEGYLAGEKLVVVRWFDNCVTCPWHPETALAVLHVYAEPPDGETRFVFTDKAYPRRLLRCPSCGHVVSPSPVPLETLYAAQYVDATYGRANLRRSFERIMELPDCASDNRQRIRRLEAFAGDRRRSVLDVGSGLGVFPAALKGRGWQVTALDPDPRVCAHIEETAGVPVICADFLQLDRVARYDIVTFNKVLEHVSDPAAMLDRARRCLDPDGLCYVEVPDADGAWSEGPGREEFFIEHLHVFTMASVAHLARQTGFRVLEAESVHEPSGKHTLRAFLAPMGTGAVPGVAP